MASNYTKNLKSVKSRKRSWLKLIQKIIIVEFVGQICTRSTQNKISHKYT